MRGRVALGGLDRRRHSCSGVTCGCVYTIDSMVKTLYYRRNTIRIWPSRIDELSDALIGAGGIRRSGWLLA